MKQDVMVAYSNNVRRRHFRHRLRVAATPVLTGTAGVAYAGFTVTASGGNAPYVFSAAGLPAGVTINGTTGEVSGTPALAGSYPVYIKVIDDALRERNLPSFTLVVA